MNNTLSKQDAAAWYTFIRILLLTLGIGFTTAGIIFFFAYNWADLHKFIKLGIIGGLLITTTVLSLRKAWESWIRNSLLTASAVLVGVLFAVFGQVYQTGANAYDFFLAWTIFITIWVLAASFPPLWILFLLLINTTLFLYWEQVASHWPDNFSFFLFFSINATVILACKLLIDAGKKIPVWFTNIIALTAISFSTIGLVNGIFGTQNNWFYVFLFVALLTYSAGWWYGLKKRSLFYLSIIPFSIIIIVSAGILQADTGAGSFLLVSLFVAGGAILIIKYMLDLQKKWYNES